MSLAENLLNTLPDDNDNTTRISNAAEEPHITVNEDRTITIPKELRTIAVVGDKNVETVTFDCVRYWDGHDLSTFAIYLNYTLPNGVTGTYIPTGIIRSADYYSFDWTIDRIMTEVAGSLEIALSAIQTDSNGAVQRQWGSLPNSDMVIAHGLPISNIPDVEEETDILSQALSELIEAKNLIGDINEALDAILAIQEELIGDMPITFTFVDLDGNAFLLNALEGMTWGEWVESEYNTVGITNGNIDGDYVGSIYYGIYYVMFMGEKGYYETLADTDLIVANREYEVR